MIADVEEYVTNSRHIEVQILADKYLLMSTHIVYHAFAQLSLLLEYNILHVLTYAHQVRWSLRAGGARVFRPAQVPEDY